MKKRLMCLILPIITLILEILPYGAVCNFSAPAEDGSIGRFRELYSYFDLTPFGYANFAPFIVALLSCVLTVMIVVSLVSKKPMRTPILTVSAVATVLSLAPLLYGISFFSIVGAFISVALALTTVVAFIKGKSGKE